MKKAEGRYESHKLSSNSERDDDILTAAAGEDYKCQYRTHSHNKFIVWASNFYCFLTQVGCKVHMILQRAWKCSARSVAQGMVWLVNHFIPDWYMAAYIWWIAIELSTDIHVPQRMNATDVSTSRCDTLSDMFHQLLDVLPFPLRMNCNTIGNPLTFYFIWFVEYFWCMTKFLLTQWLSSSCLVFVLISSF